MENIWEDLVLGKEPRGSLSTLRRKIKEEENWQAVRKLAEENGEVLEGYLQSEDAKTRKNAALLLGELEMQEAARALFLAYKNETTLFVRSSYLEALFHLEVSDMLPCFKERLKELEKAPCSPEDKKHVEEELKSLRKIVIFYEGITRHTFDCKGKECEVLLAANHSQREFIQKKLPRGKSSLHPLGILCRTADVEKLFDIRLFREILFPVDVKALLPGEAESAADALFQLGLYEKIRSLHREDGPFYFRVEYRGTLEMGKRSPFVRKFSARLMQLSEGKLINSATDYEIEVRLVENGEGKLFAALKCFTLQDGRFSYRKNAIAASIHPSTAALIMELAKPYLKEKAQIMDPFCGVGTMLLERDFCVPAGTMYATDIFGDAIEKGRENAAAARRRINFIHRDFFDFTHDYLFDEIVTNMPVRGKKSKEEQDALYGKFFDKVPKILKPDGVIIMYGNELGFVKKQLRLHRKFRLLDEICMQERTKFYLLILDMKGI